MRKSAEFQGRGTKLSSLPCDCQSQARDILISYCTLAHVPKAREHPPKNTQKPQTTRGDEEDLGPAVTVNLRRNASTDYSPCLLPERKGMFPNQIIPSGWRRRKRKVRSLPGAKAGNQPYHQPSSHALYSSTLHSSSHFLAAVSL